MRVIDRPRCRALDGLSAHSASTAGEIRKLPLAEIVGRIKPIDPAMFDPAMCELARVLAR